MWEHKGDGAHVVFSCGAVVVNDDLYVYYGATDPMDQVMAFVAHS